MSVENKEGNGYQIGSRDYLSRARRLLDDHSAESTFYAAFELRAGIESRMQQYLDAQKHVPRKHAKAWQIGKLGQHIETAFGESGNKVVSFAFHDPETHRSVGRLYYTPVTQNLRNMGQRLGEHLHAMIQYRPPDDEWWNETRGFLEEVYRELQIANAGTLVGVPLLDKETKVFTTYIEVLPGDDSEAARRLLRKGSNYLVKIEYLDEFPHRSGS
jgi:hypothetical protein